MLRACTPIAKRAVPDCTSIETLIIWITSILIVKGRSNERGEQKFLLTLHPSETPTVSETPTLIRGLFDRVVVLYEAAHEQLLLLLPKFSQVAMGEPVAQKVVALVVR